MSSEPGDDYRQREKALEDLLCTNHAYLRRLDKACHAALAADEVPAGVEKIGDLVSKLQRPQQGRVLNFYTHQGLIGLAAALTQMLFRTHPTAFLLNLLATLLFHLGEGETALRLALGSGLLERHPAAADRFVRVAIEANAIGIARRVQQEFPAGDRTLVDYLKESELLLAVPRKRECTVFVVSLETDVYRRAACRRMLEALDISYRIVDAVGPGNVPDELSRLIAPGAESDASGFGNVSHLRCWQTMIRESLDVALIIEDDAVLRGHPGLAVDLAAAGGFDLLLVNDRMAPSQFYCSSIGGLGAVPLLDALIEIAGRDPKRSAPGSDAYLLSNAAARKLVDTAYAAGFPNRNPDWNLLLWSVDRRDAAAIPESILQSVLSRRRGARLLNAGTTTRPLALHRPVGVWRDTRVY